MSNYKEARIRINVTNYRFADAAINHETCV